MGAQWVFSRGAAAEAKRGGILAVPHREVSGVNTKNRFCHNDAGTTFSIAQTPDLSL